MTKRTLDRWEREKRRSDRIWKALLVGGCIAYIVLWAVMQ